MQHQCTAALVRAKELPCCSVLLCKTGSQHACAIANTPVELCSLYRCAVMQHQSTVAMVRAKQLPCCSMLLCKTGSQHACAIANTPMEICFSYRCAVMQHQSPAALVRAHKLPHCSNLLCKTGSQQALCQCNYTLGDLLFIHVCSDATPKPCSTGQGKMASPLFCAALQNRLTTGIVSVQIHLWRFAFHTCVQ